MLFVYFIELATAKKINQLSDWVRYLPLIDRVTKKQQGLEGMQHPIAHIHDIKFCLRGHSWNVNFRLPSDCRQTDMTKSSRQVIQTQNIQINFVTFATSSSACYVTFYHKVYHFLIIFKNIYNQYKNRLFFQSMRTMQRVFWNIGDYRDFCAVCPIGLRFRFFSQSENYIFYMSLSDR